MNQRQGRKLYWEDEEPVSGAAGRGDSFWRSVWKGIERGRPASQPESPGAPAGLEPPRDYVIEAEHGLNR